ncbi:MAG: flavin reductase family protein [Pyrinomonadaceae bacterium]
MTISKDEFRVALGRFASGVTVITTRDKTGRLHGITVSAFSSVSLEPPLILVCIEKGAGSHQAFEESEFFNVNVLDETQQHFSDLFASHLPDKFDDVEYLETAKGLPFLKDALVHLECRLAYAHAGGDHTIFVGEVQTATVRDGSPLIYFHGNYQKLKE